MQTWQDGGVFGAQSTLGTEFYRFIKEHAEEKQTYDALHDNAARKAFQMIDKDDSGTLAKDEIVRAVQEDEDVISFLKTCGEANLQFLLQPVMVGGVEEAVGGAGACQRRQAPQ